MGRKVTFLEGSNADDPKCGAKEAVEHYKEVPARGPTVGDVICSPRW